MKKLLLAYTITALLLGIQPTVAQQQIPVDKTSYRDSVNKFYVQTSLPLYLYISTKPNDGNPHELSQSNSPTQYNKVEPMYLDGSGEHHIQHFDAIENKAVIFSVYADGTAPVSQSFFENSTQFKNKTQYYGVGMHVRLTNKDDMAGISKLYYSVNSEPYKMYNGNIPFSAEGTQTLKYYSTDNVGNVEKPNERIFTIDVSAPVTYYNVTGISKQDNTNIISTATVIYLEPTDQIVGVDKTYYRFDSATYTPYNGMNIPIQQLSEGEHTLYFYSIDKLQNKETEQKFEFYLDKSAPIVATDVLGDRFIVNNQVYFSGRSKLKITAVDNKIGVKDVKFSIDGAEFKKYTDPFYLPSKPGLHVVKYYAVDSLENKTIEDKKYENLVYRHNVSKVYVDLTGPDMFSEFIGDKFFTRDTLFINAQTRIKMDYTDAESGKQKLTYTLDNNPTEINYKEPITLSEPGFHKISIIGYDNVNNRNFKTISFILDNIAPEIYTKYSVASIGAFEGKDIFPPFVEVFVAPTDNLVGIKQILYSVNGQPDKEYLRKIEGFAKGQKNTVKITVIDKLNNQAQTTLEFYILEK